MYQTANIYLTSNLKMSDVILNNPYLFLLLEHFGIDVPLQDKSIQQVCDDYNLNTEVFLTFASLYNGVKYTPKTPLAFTDIQAIINYLENCHNFYSKEIYPKILSIIKQMADVNKYKEMELVKNFFIDYFNEVKEHLKYENKTVFPHALYLYKQISNNKANKKSSAFSIIEYKDHHNDIEEKLNDLKNLLIKYLPQKNDHAIRRELLFNLSELEYDLNIHSKIEDQILIPLVTKMEIHLKNNK